MSPSRKDKPPGFERQPPDVDVAHAQPMPTPNQSIENNLQIEKQLGFLERDSERKSVIERLPDVTTCVPEMGISTSVQESVAGSKETNNEKDTGSSMFFDHAQALQCPLTGSSGLNITTSVSVIRDGCNRFKEETTARNSPPSSSSSSSHHLATDSHSSAGDVSSLLRHHTGLKNESNFEQARNLGTGRGRSSSSNAASASRRTGFSVADILDPVKFNKSDKNGAEIDGSESVRGEGMPKLKPSLRVEIPDVASSSVSSEEHRHHPSRFDYHHHLQHHQHSLWSPWLHRLDLLHLASSGARKLTFLNGQLYIILCELKCKVI